MWKTKAKKANQKPDLWANNGVMQASILLTLLTTPDETQKYFLIVTLLLIWASFIASPDFLLADINP